MRGKLHAVYMQSRTTARSRRCTSCPLKVQQECCLIPGLLCLYGYTQVQVPMSCPLRQGNIVFSLERVDSSEHQAIGETEQQLSKERRQRLVAKDTELLNTMSEIRSGLEEDNKNQEGK